MADPNSCVAHPLDVGHAGARMRGWTSVSTAVTSRTETPPVCNPARRRGLRSEAFGIAVLLVTTAVLYIWNLGASGWANSFYAAAVQAGTRNWTAFLFGSSDAANAITVDKTPGALWVMGISARIFGLNSWSILVPQALEGVAAVGVLYAAVRRVGGPAAGLLAGSLLALTPVSALIFRFNNPDALLVLMIIVAAYATQRALDRDAAFWWLPLAGAAVGFGFLAKMLQALLVLPALGLVFVIAADLPLAHRIRRLAAALPALAVSGGWYLLVVELWPLSSRPYIGGSQHNSIVELALGYNGFGRVTGRETGGLGNMDGDVGWTRLFGTQMGTHIAWLLPAAIIAIAAGLCITRHAPRTDATKAALLLWGIWLLVTAVVFSYARGILHPYYTVALAPAVASGAAIGTTLLWRRRGDVRAATTLAGMVGLTAALACVLLHRNPTWLPWLTIPIAVGGIACAALLPFIGRLPGPVAAVTAAAAMAVTLASPAADAVATAAKPHTGAIPSVGPPPSPPASAPRGRGLPMLGLLGSTQPGPTLTKALRADSGNFTWAAAVVGSNNAAGYQLATGAPVMAVGGFNGTDPTPTLTQFKSYVAQRRIHWFVDGDIPRPFSGTRSGSDGSKQITHWVEHTFAPQSIDGVTVYDLSQWFSLSAHSNDPYRPHSG